MNIVLINAGNYLDFLNYSYLAERKVTAFWCVMLYSAYIGTEVSEENVASIFRTELSFNINMEGSTLLRKVHAVPTNYTTLHAENSSFMVTC